MKGLRVILLFLLLGAVVNVGVAWGLAAWPGTWVKIWPPAFGTLDTFGVESFGDKQRTYPESVDRANERRVPPELTYSFQIISWSHRFGVDLYFLDTHFDRVHTCQTNALLTGWPMRSLWEHRTSYSRGAEGSKPGSYEVWESGVMLVINENNQKIPYLPHWPGFAINTIFYAALFWLLFPGTFALRRHLRRKRGLCVKCAYDLRAADHVACPECGEEIRKINPA